MDPVEAAYGGTVAGRFDDWFPGERLVAVEGADEIATRFDALGPQRPATCGAYALAYLLPALGFETHAGQDLAAEDYLAHLAAVVVEAEELPRSDAISRLVAAGRLPADEAHRRYRREWYRFPVRASANPVESGTSPAGVARAIALATDDALVAIPIAARGPDSTPLLTPERWTELLSLLAGATVSWRWHAILNYEVNLVLRPTDPAYRPETLRRADAAVQVPRDTWGVGHFAGVLGLWRRAVDREWWIVLLDTYKERGFAGYQPQPAEAVRRALLREDGRGGGIVLVVPRDVSRPARAAIRAIGIEPRGWSNGSPEPDDWTWPVPD